jgi:uncharacterized protein (TIGR03084 family)
MPIFDDLEAEQEQLHAVLTGLTGEQWRAPSAAAGWSVADVLLHLAQTEEGVIASAAGRMVGPAADHSELSVDEWADQWVRAERTAPAEVLARWDEARRGAVAALRSAEPSQPLPWVGPPLKPATLATTRLAEHWAHALDITDGLGLPYPDTGRLRNVAWLAHRTLPYAYAVAGQEMPGPVFCDLTGPDGTPWPIGPAGAGSVISGPAAAFCRVAAQRLAPGDSGLTTTGPHAEAALRVVRTYAA